jgi:hypothetical protein
MPYATARIIACRVSALRKHANEQREEVMRVGTKSIFFGAHQFVLHPLFCWEAWRRLYGFPVDPRLYFAFAVHDLGYLFRSDMDGCDGEKHVEFGARIMKVLFGDSWGDFCGRHSRHYARARGLRISRLCVADKLAFVLTPAWLYLPMARATGELAEYMVRAKERQAGSEHFTASEAAKLSSADPREWLSGLKSYTRRWVKEHRDCCEDNWTVATQPSVTADSGRG